MATKSNPSVPVVKPGGALPKSGAFVFAADLETVWVIGENGIPRKKRASGGGGKRTTASAEYDAIMAGEPVASGYLAGLDFAASFVGTSATAKARRAEYTKYAAVYVANRGGRTAEDLVAEVVAVGERWKKPAAGGDKARRANAHMGARFYYEDAGEVMRFYMEHVTEAADSDGKRKARTVADFRARIERRGTKSAA